MAFGCCGAETRKFRKPETENDVTVDFIGGLINSDEPRRRIFGVDEDRLAAICAKYTPSEAEQIRKCKCDCHVDGLTVLC
jgi:hypothetical protein